MEIQQEESTRTGKFFVLHHGKEAAIMTYAYAGKHLIITHTEVDDIFKGQGVGYKLVETAVDFARAKGIKIKPLCPFANAIFKKRVQEYADVIL